jgi:uncharacterized protein YndB with AHSA1/START domain
MPKAEQTVSIGRPVEAVFAYLADGEKCPEWRSGVLDITRVSGDGRVGTRYGSAVQRTMEAEVRALDRLKTLLEASA